MSVWVTVPSKRPPEEVQRWALAWKAMGYSIALWRDPGESEGVASHVDMVIVDPYQGYAVATNKLIQYAIGKGAQWCVIGGDDVWPDTTKRADEIAAECEKHFGGTFGIMQPCSDRWGESAGSIAKYGPDRAAYIDRIAGSAWFGREACRRLYGGNGPLWTGYAHMFVDQEACEVGDKLGIYWRRRDIGQKHEHWARPDNRTREDCPHFLREVSGSDHWEKYRAIYEDRARLGFPGHEPCA